ncbi:ATP-binding protein [Saprospiraceae bacterium]|nr:ATP-binding protein [Saprospiraceae bacterium]
MNIRNAERKKAKIKLAIQGSSGSGKSLSSLFIAEGLTGDLSKVIVIDTENGSADLYAHHGDYKVLSIQAPFTPEKYIKAIEVCVKAGAECIIIDSISHAWSNLLEYHSNLTGNSFTNWNKITPRHLSFINKMMDAPVHIIATMRVKQDYVLNQKDGKYIPEKVGLKAIQRDGVDYEFTLVFDLDIKHNCTCSKDRTGLFMDQPEFKITSETGIKIINWCNQGIPLENVKSQILDCQSLEQLTAVYKKYTAYYSELTKEFADQKETIQNNQFLNLKRVQNGTTNHQ